MLQMKSKVSITLPKLPYMENALEPVISARTISVHFGKHHAGYVENLNDLVAGTPFDGRPLADPADGALCGLTGSVERIRLQVIHECREVALQRGEIVDDRVDVGWRVGVEFR